MLFQTKKPHYQHLHQKWTARHRQLQNKLWEKHGESLNWLNKNIAARHIAAGSLGGLLLLSTPVNQALPQSHLTFSRDDIIKDYDRNILLAEQLKKIVPSDVRPLDPAEEQKISTLLSNSFGFKTLPEIDNKRLNRTYGLIGGEQHLYRYPGDNVYNHANTSVDWAKFGDAGIAPGLGAWGYFAPSQSQLTDTDKTRERYYIAVQTFLAPGFAERTAEYRDFFKYRKMLVINPQTGQAVVTDIADAGPAEWTGKHLGGSPEVMDALGLGAGPRKGPVLYFFVDDPGNNIPLGPVKALDNMKG